MSDSPLESLRGSVPLQLGDVVACTVTSAQGFDRWYGEVVAAGDAGLAGVSFGDARNVRVCPPGALTIVYRAPPRVVQCCRLPYALAGTVERVRGVITALPWRR